MKVELSTLTVSALALLVFKSLKKEDGARPGQIVETENGPVRSAIWKSRDERYFFAWLGMRYAEPPVGTKRFKSSEPFRGHWAEPKDAIEFGPLCAQMEILSARIEGAEDCLHLNVFVPEKPFKKAVSSPERHLLPVLVWIHPGYFACGSAQLYNPMYLMDEDVVVVTLSYRVGALGFLNMGTEDARGNMGLKDQNMALKWVRANIEGFGGDPYQVTIAGTSAGAASVHFHMMSPKSRGLFSRAISQSGTAFSPWSLNEEPEGQARYFASKVGCHSKSTEETLACIKDLPIEKLLRGHSNTANPDRKKRDLFAPTLETIPDSEAFLTVTPDQAYASGQVTPVPWLTGVTSDEGVFMVLELYRNATVTSQVTSNPEIVYDSILHLPKQVYPLKYNRILDFYLGVGPNASRLNLQDPEVLQSFVRMSSDRMFANSCQKGVLKHSRMATVYPYWYTKRGKTLAHTVLALRGKYPFEVEMALHAVRQRIYGVFGLEETFYGISHGDETAMLFYIPEFFFTVMRDSPHYEFSKQLVRTWVSFAKGEQPQFRNQKFPAATPGNVRYLTLDDHAKLVPYPNAERYLFWEQLGLV